MRIALNGRFYGARITGVQRFAREVVRRLPARADMVLLLPRGVAAPHLDGDVPVVRATLSGHAFEQLEFPWRARQARCDVCLNLSGTLPGWGGPHVAVVHDVIALTHPEWFSPAFAAWYRFAVGRNARLATRLVTVSHWSAQQIASTLHLDEENIIVTRQGAAPFDEPATAEMIASVRRRYDLPERFVLALGGGDPRKNAPFIINVMREWWRRATDAPSLVVVYGASTRVHGHMALEKPSEQLCVLDHVDDDELRALYTAAVAFAFPSLAEGFGRSPLEAAACGTPTVVGPYGAAREVLGDEAAILPLDVDAWIAELRAITVVGPERDLLVARGRMAARSYNWDEAARQVLGACEDAAGRTPAALGV
jgi:glycosyltransferase involved in cell wall biosynthesis